MNKELIFLKDEKSGDIFEKIVNNEVEAAVSGLTVLNANSTDAAGEKHVPVIEVSGNKVCVKVGSVAHPMTDAHHIAFVVLVTEKGVQRVDLAHDAEPVAEFALQDGDKVVAAYEYCNLHGLWVAKA
ncbi:desulfoferrodoxin family protein [Peptostreptococcus faecalis]|uniref:desulfoferrodoxin family protein n=1 Tax=Peptostreptococcus faecalis TaxID=2045015 RepID=UPI000C7E6FA0|nr:desulfoferrodoxin family protein [Peptostreptococcus faecalis]